jgi:biotin synthase
MNFNSKYFLDLSEKIINGYKPHIDEYRNIALIPDEFVFSLLAGSNLIRETFFGNSVHLCTICNGKSGHCSEDCKFCSQSSLSQSFIKTHALLPKYNLQEGAIKTIGTPINRYSIVTSGKRLPRKEVQIVADAISELEQKSLKYCASLGTLKETEFDILIKAGITKYHHNLEASKSHFPTICSSHSFEERLETIQHAKKVGMSVCSGGIFGTGESDEQVLELGLTLKQLDVDSIPINFLTPIKGTPFESKNYLTPLKCLKIISLYRYLLPEKEIIVCGGRIQNLKDLHPFIFHAGASGIMTGNYLTTDGQTLEKDLELLETLKFQQR